MVHDYTHTVSYKGFVYTKDTEGRAPGLSQVRTAAELLCKPKKARDVHPLFARGFDTKLTMRVREDGLRVFVKDDGQQPLVVMDLAVHKMAYVISQDKDIFFVARHDLRGKGVMYKVHGFKVASASEAKKLSHEISVTVNSFFKKLKNTREFVKRRVALPRQTSSSDTASMVANEGGVRMRHTGPVDEEVEHLKMFIDEARKSLLDGGKPKSPEVAKAQQKAKTAEELQRLGLEDLRRELDEALAAASQDFSDATSSDDIIGYDETYSDEFARMTMFVHSTHSVDQDVPRYAEITLDSDFFDYSFYTSEV